MATVCVSAVPARATETAAKDSVELARPTAVQYAYHEQERIQFVSLDPCTWQGREYDNHTTDLKDMKLPKLDVDQWCEAAKSWGAKEILFVAKHTGGFCWWQTETTEHSVKNMLKANHDPAIKEWQLFSPRETARWQPCHTVPADAFKNGVAHVEIDISKYIDRPGQFPLRFDVLGHAGAAVGSISVLYDGRSIHEQVLSAVKAGEVYLLNRHAQIVEDSKIELEVMLRATQGNGASRRDKADASVSPTPCRARAQRIRPAPLAVVDFARAQLDPLLCGNQHVTDIHVLG